MRRRNGAPLFLVALTLLALVVVFTGGGVSHGQGAGERLDLDPPILHPPRILCGTGLDRAATMDGTPTQGIEIPIVDFNSAVVRPDYTGPVEVELWVFDGEGKHRSECVVAVRGSGDSWEKYILLRVKVSDGWTICRGPIPVGAFERLWIQQRGVDKPLALAGEILPDRPDAQPGRGEGREIYLRVRVGASEEDPGSRTVYATAPPALIPRAQVTRISDAVQFTSHILNLVIPGFGDSRLTLGTTAFELEQAAQEAYKWIEDSYEFLAFVPHQAPTAKFQAFHRVVKNEVQGIGLEIFDHSARYGSGGTLQGVEVFFQNAFVLNSISSHALAHQWGSYFDWAKIAEITRAGLSADTHMPLWGDPKNVNAAVGFRPAHPAAAPGIVGETYLGAVLWPWRRVARTAAGGWEIERTPAPIGYDPLTLYAMGKIGPEALNDFVIFDEQGQFDAENASAPAPGTPVRGTFKTRSINDVIARHGRRSGPSPTTVSRATILVSRERLATQEDLDYWTFYAQRLEDPERTPTGVMSWEGLPSFRVATGVELKTDTRPRPPYQKITQRMPVDCPGFGARDWRGFELDQPVASCYKVGDRLRISGRVIATDRTDFNQVSVRLSKYGGTDAEAIRVSAPIDARGRFSAEVVLTEAQRGRYVLSLYLFWPNSGGQLPRSTLSPVHVG